MKITIDFPEELIALHEKWVRIKMKAYDDDLIDVADAIGQSLATIKLNAFHKIVDQYRKINKNEQQDE